MLRSVPFTFCLFLLTMAADAQDFNTVFEKTNGAQTATYAQVMDFYQKLVKVTPTLKMQRMGLTDSGEPLHLILHSPDKDFDLASLRRKNRRILLINNGIHPGEPDGIDASMLLLRDLATGKLKLPANLILAVVPCYNIDGLLNRSPYSRVNQNGPLDYGFRANARNYDLNRDFTKSDTRNARAFAELFHTVDPDVFVDTHVSNGADYQHVMTLIASQPDKLGGAMGKFYREMFEPFLFKDMERKGFPMIPYVTNFGPKLAEEGMEGFVDTPRYSTGYAALFQTFGFMPETHMLKPYAQRVQATYQLLLTFLDFTSRESILIGRLRRQAREAVKTQTEFALGWQKDPLRYDQIPFRGYAAAYRPSEVSGQPRLYYDRNQPFTQTIRYFNYFLPTNVVRKPAAYLIPQGWWNVIDLLKLNGVVLQRLSTDTTVSVEVTRIDDYKSAPRPFEGHHLNFDVKTSVTTQAVQFRKGDYLIPTNRAANRYLVEMLEPTGSDSFFAWNFFDAILQQKEGFSDYVFEDVAANFLAKNPALKAELEQKRRADPAFAKSGRAQLDWVFRRSPWYEKEHLRYPVFRVLNVELAK
ncbi:MAG: hypothetical protein LH606_16660 [Cytophagaceae bacterium]|nr:hypothetical protein [Cytophagaceae bacterium]